MKGLVVAAIERLRRSKPAQVSELVLDRDTLDWVVLMLETRLRYREGARDFAKFFEQVRDNRRVNPLPLDVDLNVLDPKEK